LQGLDGRGSGGGHAGGPDGGGGGGGGGAPITVGKLRGEDYNFEFVGKLIEGKMHFRLIMTEAGLPPPPPTPPVGEDGQAPPPTPQPFVRTIDFVFDPEVRSEARAP
jgi:hypothetical protein